MSVTSFKVLDTTVEDHYELPISMRARPAVSRLPRRIELLPEPKRSVVSTSMFLATDVGSRFGARLRDLRRSHKLTQLDMAVSFGIDRSYISDVECGKKGISLATLEVIALGFSMKLSDLLEDL
jgi:DNA-binding XRE family transcriptional regulator